MSTATPLTQTFSAVQNGTLAQAIAEVCAERDRLQSELHLAKEDAALWKKSEGECCAAYDKLEAQCAALRSALEDCERWIRFVPPPGTGILDEQQERCITKAQAALATDAGKGYVPAAEHDRTILAKAQCEQALDNALTELKAAVPADKARVIVDALQRHVRHTDRCRTGAGHKCDCTDGMKVAHELGLLGDK